MTVLRRITCLLAFVASLPAAQALQSVDNGPVPEPPPADTSDTLEAFDSRRGGPDTIEYQALSLEYDMDGRSFTLMDKAQLKYRGATLEADTIWLDQDSSILQAAGRPVLRDAKNPPIAGYRMRYNGSRRIGQVWYGSSFRDGQQFHGMDIRRLTDGRLLVTRGDFSTCALDEDQHYYFYTRRMVVKPRESVTARPVVLNISDVPVAVLPMLVSPLKSGRRSGLLTPRFGGDQVMGFYLRDLGFYWATNDYMDLTIRSEIVEGQSADFENSNVSTEYRYAKRYVLDGSVNGKAYLERFDPANSGWEVRFAHKQNLTPDQRTTLIGEGSFVSSQSVRQDNALDATTTLDQQANAHMTLTRRFRNSSTLSITTRQDYNLVTGTKSQELPKATWSIGGPVIEQDASDTATEWYHKFNYTYTNNLDHWRISSPDTTLGKDTGSVHFGYKDQLHLDYSGQIFSVINVTPRADFSGNWTARTYNPNDTDSVRVSSWDFDPNRGEWGSYFLSHQYGVNTDTKLYGIWRPEIGRFVGVRHTITPGLSYTWAPEIDTNRSFAPQPKLGQTYWQTEQKTLGMSLANDFDVKYWNSGGADTLKTAAAPPSTNLRALSLSSNTSYNFAADSFQWAPIVSTVRIQPVQNWVFQLNLQHKFYHDFSERPRAVQVPELVYYSYELGKRFQWNGEMNAGLKPEKGRYETLPWSANVDYAFRFSSTRVGKTVFRDVASHSASSGLSLKPSRYWTMRYNNTYDFTEGEFSSHIFGFERELHCWKMTFDWTPVGPSAGWHFQIFVTDLPDIRLQASSLED